MEQDNLLSEFDTLPPEAQKQVLDFIAFLQTRYQQTPKAKKTKTRISEEPFAGIWRSRKDLQKSSAWVRETRSSEWGEKK